MSGSERKRALAARLLVSFAVVASLAAAAVAGGSGAGAAEPPPQVTVDADATLNYQTILYGGAINRAWDVTQGYPPTTLNLRTAPGWSDYADYTIGLSFVRTADGALIAAYCPQWDLILGDDDWYAAGGWPDDRPGQRYAEYIVRHYYPVTDLPTEEPSADRYKAAEVQAAIWFFTDGFAYWQDRNNDGTWDGAEPGKVDPMRTNIENIVNDALANAGSDPTPPAPVLTITGPTTGTATVVAGPYAVTANDTAQHPVTLTVTGVEAFADAAGTVPLGSSFLRDPGAPFYLVAAVPGSVAISATGQGDIDVGTPLLFVSSPDPMDEWDGQMLVAAGTGQVPVAAALDVVFAVAPEPAPTPGPTTPVAPAGPQLAASGGSAGGVTLLTAGLLACLGTTLVLVARTRRHTGTR